MRRNILIYLIFLTSVTIGGEFRVYEGISDIRVSLGTPIFFFFLLWAKQLRPIRAGISAGIVIVLFRTILSFSSDPSLGFFAASLDHLPVFFYYSFFAIFFNIFKVRRFYDRSIIIALIGIGLENIASWAELTFSSLILNVDISLQLLFTVLVISFFRSFFVLGIINFSLLREANIKHQLEQHRSETMLLAVADLFVEMVQLQKSMKSAEKTTRDLYGLYKELSELGNKEMAKQTLKIAGEVHEIKKDNQRVYAGLAKLRLNEYFDTLMPIEEIVNVAVTSNKNYVKQLHKKIDFETEVTGEHQQYNHLIILSIINNLITNAVEAIESRGKISVLLDRIEDNLHLTIMDDGPGIPSDRNLLVFEPGYTTKFDETGVASNGIGLSHIKEVINDLGGNIELYSMPQLRITKFLVIIPCEQIIN